MIRARTLAPGDHDSNGQQQPANEAGEKENGHASECVEPRAETLARKRVREEFAHTPFSVIERPAGNPSRDEPHVAAVRAELECKVRVSRRDGTHLVENLRREEWIVDRAQ